MKKQCLPPIVAIFLCCCANSGKQDSLDYGYLLHPSKNVFREWRENHSYYALLEIVDAYIDPYCHKATKADVLKYLGRGIDSPNGYPNAGPKMWVYGSSRRVPYGAVLSVLFDDGDRVIEIDWASE